MSTMFLATGFFDKTVWQGGFLFWWQVPAIILLIVIIIGWVIYRRKQM